MIDKKAPVYVIKPSCQFRQPFRFDFDKPSSRDFQNDEITEYFNYGFSEITMNPYIKKLKLSLKTIDKNLNKTYKINQHNLIRLNDQIPFDFGGFSNFYDQGLLKNDKMPELIHNSDQLINFFIEKFAFQENNSNPLLQFIKCIYTTEEEDKQISLDKMVEQIQENLQSRYEVMMRKAEELKEPNKNLPAYHPKRKSRERERSKQQKSRKQRKKSRKRSKDKSRERQRSRNKKSRSRDRNKQKQREKKQKDIKKKKSKKSRSRSERSRSQRKKKYRQ